MAEFDCCYIYLITYVHVLLHSPILLDLIGIKLLLYSDSFVGIKPEVTSLNRPNNQMYSEVYSVTTSICTAQYVLRRWLLVLLPISYHKTVDNSSGLTRCTPCFTRNIRFHTVGMNSFQGLYRR